MLAAIRASDHKKVFGQFIPKNSDEKYYCPECASSLIHHKSLSGVKVGHFKHRAGVSDCCYAGESMEHLLIKSQILNYLRESYGNALKFIEPEYRDLAADLRPDIFLITKKNCQIAIEVQVSPINIDELTRRMKAYTRVKTHMLWILPFESERFFQDRPEYGWTHESGQYIKHLHTETVKTIRLSEAEVFLYWASFKKLFFWDISAHDPGFIVCNLAESYTPGRDVLIDGEQKKYFGRKNSMIKLINALKKDVGFNDFYPTYVRAFRSRIRPYPIPARLMLLHKQ